MSNAVMTTGKVRSFTDLHAWQEAHKLVLMIYSITKTFPADERFGLVSQLRRAAVSVTSNIAEGFRRRSHAEKRQFYTTALASLTEIQNQMLVSRDVHYIQETDFMQVDQHTIRVTKLLFGLRRSAELG